MAAPELAFVKSWCRIDGSEQDPILPVMINEATVRAGHETGANYVAVDMPESVKIWVAAQVAHWLKSPEAAQEGDLKKNPFLDGLLDPYRKFAMEVKIV